MANRRVMEVLKWTDPVSILTSAVTVCRLWKSVSNSDELWRDQTDSLSAANCTPTSATAKLRFREVYLHSRKQCSVLVDRRTLRIYCFRSQRFLKEVSLPEEVLDTYCAAALVSHKLLFACGGDKSARASMISLLDGSVSAQPSMKHARKFHSALSKSHYIYVFGGYCEGVLRSAERFDVSSRSWRRLPDMITARRNFTACDRDALIYLCGGLTHQCETFDIQAERFRELACRLRLSDWTLTFLYQEEVVTVVSHCSYSLKESGWTLRDGVVASTACGLHRWGNITPGVYQNFVYVSVFSSQQVMRIDMNTMECDWIGEVAKG